MFLSNGFNDFLSKPIELRELDRILRRWLPQDCLEMKRLSAQGGRERQTEGQVVNAIVSDTKDTLSGGQFPEGRMWPSQINGIDIEVAKHFFGDDVLLFRQVLSDYYYSGQMKKELVRQAYENRDFDVYALETHSLKSSSKSIGAMVLAEEALELELAAKRKDEDVIVQKHQKFYNNWVSLLENLKMYANLETKEDVEEEHRTLMRIKELKKRLLVLKKLMERMENWETMQREQESRLRLQEDVLGKLENLLEFRYSRETLKIQIQDIKSAFEHGDVEQALEILKECEKQL